VHLLDYAVYIYCKQFEMVWHGLATKIGLHRGVAITHLSPGTHSLLVSQTPPGGSKDVGREHTNAMHFCPTFYRCIMGKKNQLKLSLA
jgi:hypothetical protein